MPEQELSSWKEIATYLGVSVRTAQGWERERGLPVRRLPGGRGRVSVTAAELEQWKRSGDERKVDPEPPPRRRTSRWWWLAIAGVLASAFLIGVPLLPRVSASRPASYRVLGNALIISDVYGRELWRKAFPYALYQDLQTGQPFQYIWFGDLDAQPSVLLVPAGPGVARDTAPLICYTERGDERWRFVPGRRVRTSSEEFDAIFGAPRFLVGPIGDDGRTAIVVVAAHHLLYPTQVTLLAASGKVAREYWHSGHFNFARFADLDGDRKNELYLAGVSNGWKAATIVVLDPETFTGASLEPESPDHQLLGFGPGRERKRVILPRSCLSRSLDPFNSITGFWISGRSFIVETLEHIEQAAGVLHQIDSEFRTDHVEFADSYRVRYAQFKAAGQLPPSCTLEESLSKLTVLPAADPPSTR